MFTERTTAVQKIAEAQLAVQQVLKLKPTVDDTPIGQASSAAEQNLAIQNLIADTVTEAREKLDGALGILSKYSNSEVAQARAHEVYGDMMLEAEIAGRPGGKPEEIAFGHYSKALDLIDHMKNPDSHVDEIMRITCKMIRGGVYNLTTAHQPNGKEKIPVAVSSLFLTSNLQGRRSCRRTVQV